MLNSEIIFIFHWYSNGGLVSQTCWWFWVCQCCTSGDLEHTHLVKGLDYALLNKVRSEIDKKPDGGDDIDGKSR